MMSLIRTGKSKLGPLPKPQMLALVDGVSLDKVQKGLESNEELLGMIQNTKTSYSSKPKKHWYCLSFFYVGKNKEPFTISIYIDLDAQEISKKIIDDCKLQANVKDNAVLIANPYLGYMTFDEFHNQKQSVQLRLTSLPT